MVRRNAQAGAPAVVGRSVGGNPDDESAFQRFKRSEWDNPEKRAGNVNIVLSLGLFFGSIAAIRLFGDAIAPA
ncbi:hypothetical protein DL93DRAFT_2056569 [Clavulina sp. PMI_390]|nr:hypothetical protein DL93DRAFT_2056569 [Clavulina sp. PMI_390]